MITGYYAWSNSNKDKAIWVPHPEGKFIIGCDPYYKPSWWQKILIRLGLRKDKSISIMGSPLPKDFVDVSKIKLKDIK